LAAAQKELENKKAKRKSLKMQFGKVKKQKKDLKIKLEEVDRQVDNAQANVFAIQGQMISGYDQMHSDLQTIVKKT